MSLPGTSLVPQREHRSKKTVDGWGNELNLSVSLPGNDLGSADGAEEPSFTGEIGGVDGERRLEWWMTMASLLVALTTSGCWSRRSVVLPVIAMFLLMTCPRWLLRPSKTTLKPTMAHAHPLPLRLSQAHPLSLLLLRGCGINRRIQEKREFNWIL